MRYIAKIKPLKDLMGLYTRRAHGFKKCLDYYKSPFVTIFLHAINTHTDYYAKMIPFWRQCYPSI